MKNFVLLAAMVVAAFVPSQATAERPLGRLVHLAARGSSQEWAARQPWHGEYYYVPYGQPTALVVPPTAVMQQNYSWGVSQNTMTPIYHQYGAAAIPSAGGAFYATPRWPSHTRQFGVYPVRAPW